MGPVFRAFDPDRDRLVAIKLFTLDLAPERVHQVVAEFEGLLGGALTHPAIAAPLGAGIHDNHPYLALEYVSADSLDVVTREQGPASPADALRVAAQLAGGLDFAAVDDIVHGALHPRDVLLTPEDTRLTGLGIARAFERVKVAAPIRRPYTPPECIAGTAWDRRADVFSLAALMHEMLWGRRVSAMGAQAGESLTELAGGNLDALSALFARALAENPADRFETALEFAEGLKQAFPKVVLAAPRVQRSTPQVAVVIEPRLPLEEADPEPADVNVQAGVVHAFRPAESVDLKVRATAAADAVLGEFGIREATNVRYEVVESAPAVVDAPPPDESHVSAGVLNGYTGAKAFALEQSRSAVWPLVLALVVGAAIGFGGGYFFANYERAIAPETPETVASAEPPPSPGREWTESTATEPAAKPEPLPTPAPTPAPRVPVVATVKPEAANGRLLVRSTPAGARVFVDGREHGKTPITVGDLAQGVHRVRVAREGYLTEERRVTITESRPAQSMTVPLTRQRSAEEQAPKPAPAAVTGPGALTVISRPAGAKVFLDGKLIGTTPLQLPGVDPGVRAVRLELDGYRRWSSSVRIAPSAVNRVTASLER